MRCKFNPTSLSRMLNSHELVGNYNTLLGRAKRQSRASGKLEKRRGQQKKTETIWKKTKDKYCSIRPQTESHV